MKTNIIFWSVILTAMSGITADALENGGDLGKAQEYSASQIIMLNDDTKLTLLGTTHGYRHAPPHIAYWNWIDTVSNTTVVWIEAEHKTNQWPSYELLVYDQSNTACVNIEQAHPSTRVKPGVDIYGFALNAFPKWERETILRVRPYYGVPSTEQFVITNPAPASVADWTPKPLPDTESDGDLAVTLTKLVAGAPAPYRQGSEHPPITDPAKQCVHLDFDIRQNGQPTTNWEAWPVRTFDAFGNQVRGLIRDYLTNGIIPVYPDRVHPSFPLEADGYYYRPGLWPDESPWKVRMEFIRRSGFSDDEIVTFTNLPVKPGSQQDWDDEWSAWDIGNTNFPFTITPATVNGVHLKLLPPLLVANPNSPGQKYIGVIIGADPDFNPQGMNLTVLQATDDQGRDIDHPFGSPWAGHYSLDFPNIRDVKSLNLKLALHKSRFVEFTVKPTKQ